MYPFKNIIFEKIQGKGRDTQYLTDTRKGMDTSLYLENLSKTFLIVPILLWDTRSFSHSKGETILYFKRLYGY